MSGINPYVGQARYNLVGLVNGPTISGLINAPSVVGLINNPTISGVVD